MITTRKITELLAVLLICSLPLAAQTDPAATTTTDKGEPAVIEKESALEGLSINGMLRVRPEIKSNLGFKPGKDKQANFVGQKAQIKFTKQFKDASQVVITLQDSRLWGANTASLGAVDTSATRIITLVDKAGNTQQVKISEEATDIREGYLLLKSVFSSPVDMQLGRQILVYGDQRTLGHLDWSNVGRSFDGIRLKYDIKNKNSMHLFGSVLSEGNASDLQNVSVHSTDRGFAGLYNSYRALKEVHVDTFVYSRFDMDASDREELYTVGVRMTTKTQKNNAPQDAWYDATFEVNGQTGRDSAKRDVSAWAAAISAGLYFEAGFKMRLGAEMAAASGDGNANDNQNHTFTNLYHTNHMHYGHADLVSWQNMAGASANLKVFFSKQLSLAAAFWNINRLNANDNWYNVAGGSSVNALTAPLNGRKHLYNEIDLDVKYKAREFLTFTAGYAIALPGNGLIDVKPKDNYHFAYLATTVKF